ncbi:MAG: DNA repair protein RecO [Fimbriimonadaceae bacterium]|nr:DNA repair protein RecO [Fimbriimonadaceae bacterium]
MSGGIVEGICLRRTAYGEHDAVVTWFCDELGKRSAMVRGVTRPTSQHLAACQLFVQARLLFSAGKRLPVLTQSEVLESHYGLRADLLRTACATYAVELLDRAVEEAEPLDGAYDLLRSTLGHLVAAAEPEPALLSYELRLVTLLGYQPVLDRCARCGDLIRETRAWFVPPVGGLVHWNEAAPSEPAVAVDPRAVKALRRLIDPQTYGLDLRLAHLPAELAGPLRAAVRAFTQEHLETNPKSLRFLEQVLHDTDAAD